MKSQIQGIIVARKLKTTSEQADPHILWSFEMEKNQTSGVKVFHGVNDGVFPVVGSSTASVHESLRDAFNLPSEAVAFANGRRISNNYRLHGGDVLEFIVERGVKGGHKPTRITEAELHQQGLTVVGNEVVPITDTKPDFSWDTDRLTDFVKGRVASSKLALTQSLLQAHKSAVDLFYAGWALWLIRTRLKSAGHGKWQEWKVSNALPDTTVNDAIRLYESAKTEDALKGMGITEAKKKFIEVTPRIKKEANNSSGSTTLPKKVSRSCPVDVDHDGSNEELTVIEGIDTNIETEEEVGSNHSELTTELNKIAQRLEEIAQDEMGTIDWSEEDKEQFQEAVDALEDGIEKIKERFENDAA